MIGRVGNDKEKCLGEFFLREGGGQGREERTFLTWS